jgi:hypothetical protein
MSDVFSALPSRALHARPPKRPMGVFWALVGLAMFGAFLFGVAYYVAPVLVTDWQVRDVAVPLRGAHLTGGSCYSKLFVHDCSATLTLPGGTAPDRDVHYVFGSFTFGGFTARVVGDPQRPAWLTTDLGLDYFWDRVLTFLVIAGSLALLVGTWLLGILGLLRTRRAWQRASLVPVPLQLMGMQKGRDGMVWTVRAENGRTAQWTFSRRAKPFVLGPGDRVLGLAMPGGGSIFPLDAGLRWVDLSAAEREAALRARPA